MSPERIGALQGRFMAAFGARMVAGYDRKMASIAAKKKPKAARPKAKPVAVAPKPVSRAARLARAEAEVRAVQPRDARCVWRGMSAA
jgi:hypothetical protein